MALSLMTFERARVGEHSTTLWPALLLALVACTLMILVLDSELGRVANEVVVGPLVSFEKRGP